MDTAVALASAYLHLDGHFVETEIPVMARIRHDQPRFQQSTEVDALGIRFPVSAHRRPPRESRRRAGLVSVDSGLEAPGDQTAVIIGEVSEFFEVVDLKDPVLGMTPLRHRVGG